MTTSLYALEDSPAIIPEPRKFSTPNPSSFPEEHKTVILYKHSKLHSTNFNSEMVVFCEELIFMDFMG